MDHQENAVHLDHQEISADRVLLDPLEVLDHQDVMATKGVQVTREMTENKANLVFVDQLELEELQDLWERLV